MSEVNECARDVKWGDETYTLNLNDPWVRNVLTYRGLPGPNGSTPQACLGRFESGNYSTDDVERVLELGLIGGGMAARDADKLLNAYVRGKPIATNAGSALAVLVGLYVGMPRDDASA